jgi:hypothetical protein
MDGKDNRTTSSGQRFFEKYEEEKPKSNPPSPRLRRTRKRANNFVTYLKRETEICLLQTAHCPLRTKNFISFNTNYFSHSKLPLIFANVVRKHIGGRKSPIGNFKY